MLASITPLGQRGRGASWRRITTAYVAASVTGGALTGLVLGGAGQALLGHPRSWAVIAAAALALLAAAWELHGARPPSLRRQVDENWLGAYRDWVCGVGFGFQLGLGVVTIVTSVSLYLVWLLEAVTAAPAAGAAIGAVFGLARAAPLLSMHNVHDPASLRVLHRRWQRLRQPTARVVAATEAVVAVALLAVAR